MRLLVRCTVLLLAACWIEPIWIEPISAATYSAASLASELRRLQDETDGGRKVNLPEAWEVEAPDGKYSVPTRPLTGMLQSGDRAAAAGWLDHLARNLEESARPAGDNGSGARAKLSRILARREFGRVAPPSFWDGVRQRIIAWIQEWLERIFGFVAQHPNTSKALFWTLIAGASGLLVMWLVRLGSRDRTTLNLTARGEAIPTRAWAEWIAAARQAADRGDLREAIHCAYWAGIARLQETGVISRERTRTPREYLRGVSDSGAPAAKPLAELTSGMERFWYAGRTPGPDDFRASLKNLEGLGCRVD